MVVSLCVGICVYVSDMMVVSLCVGIFVYVCMYVCDSYLRQSHSGCRERRSLRGQRR